MNLTITTVEGKELVAEEYNGQHIKGMCTSKSCKGREYTKAHVHIDGEVVEIKPKMILIREEAYGKEDTTYKLVDKAELSEIMKAADCVIWG